MESLLSLIAEDRNQNGQRINNDAFADVVREIQMVLGEPIHIWRYPQHGLSERAWFYQVSVGKGWANIRTVSGWVIGDFAGCPGIAVFHSVYIHPDFCRKGLGYLLNKLRIAIATHECYTLAVCTWALSNIAQKKILEKNGWKKIDEYERVAAYIGQNPPKEIICLSSIKLKG